MKIRFLLVFLIMFTIKNTLLAKENVNLYDFSLEDIDGKEVNLKKFTGKPILIVNTASRCGFTSQYEDLQDLWSKLDRFIFQLDILKTVSGT